MGGSSSSQTVGYKYLLGMHIVLAEALDRVLGVKFSDRVAWEGVSESGQIAIDRPELFGGKSREGGVSGRVDFLPGGTAQATNDYLASRLGALTPAFRGVASLVFRQFYFGNNPYIKPLAVRASAIHVHGGDWYPAKAEIGADYAVEDTAMYIALDVSTSMAGSKLANMKTAMTALLEDLRGTSTHIKLVAWAATVVSSIERFNTVDSDFDDLIAWVDGLAMAIGTNFDAGVSLASAFFTDADALDADADSTTFDLNSAYDEVDGLTGGAGEATTALRRVIIFLTDGEPTPESSATDAAATLAAIPRVEVFAFNIDLTNTTFTELLDNTPQDGVPVVAGGDPEAMLAAVSSAFLTWVDMNPAHILRDALGGKLGFDRFGTSWEDAADQLFAEGFGLSFRWQTPSNTEEFVQLVEGHIDAQHYEDPNTGMVEIALLRDDYDVETLPVFGAGGDYPVMEWVDPAWPQPDGLPNQVSVKYSRRDGTQGAVTYANIATVQTTGRVVPEALDYLGITRHDVAARVCLRDLAARTTPLLGGGLYVKHLDPALHEGSPILLNEPRLGIVNIVARIVEIEESNGTDNRVLVKFLQDKFALGSVALVTDPGEVVVSNDPAASAIRMVEEAPYYALVMDQGQANVDSQLSTEPDQGALQSTCQNPDGRHQSYMAALSTDGETTWVNKYSGDFAPATTLSADLAAEANVTTASLVYDPSLSYARVGALALIGSEYIRVDAMTVVGGVVQATIGRGCLDTVPVAHSAGDGVLFWQDFVASDEVAYLATEVLDVRLRPRTSSGVLRLGAATTDTVTFASRAIRPYPPGKFQADASYAGATWDGSVALTWAHRDRTMQTTAIIEDFTASSIGPEAGTTYTVKVSALNEAKAELDVLLTTTGLTGTSLTVNAGDFTTAVPALTSWFRFEVWSVRDGYASWQVPFIDMVNSVEFLLISSSDELDPTESELLSGDEQTGDDKTLIYGT